MRQISNLALKSHFIAWQCRIRQLAARDFGGQPMPAMRPRASTRKGGIILPDMTVLLVPRDPVASTAYFRFQMQKTNEPEKARQAGLGYLAGDFYQLPELFSDELTAVFGPFQLRRMAHRVHASGLFHNDNVFIQVPHTQPLRVRVLRQRLRRRMKCDNVVLLQPPGIVRTNRVLHLHPPRRNQRANLRPR